jgi:hypothetical protein
MMAASYDPRLPLPINPTLILELAWEPRTSSGLTIVNAVAAAAPRWNKDLRETGGCGVFIENLKGIIAPGLPWTPEPRR